MKSALSKMIAVPALLAVCINPLFAEQEQRPRAWDIGLQIGTMATGTYNAVTDVAGVRTQTDTFEADHYIKPGEENSNLLTLKRARGEAIQSAFEDLPLFEWEKRTAGKAGH